MSAAAPDTWWARLRRSVGFRLACVLLAVIGTMAVVPQLIVAPSPAASDPTACSLRDSEGNYQDRLAPSAQHWFGTDSQGCDEFARVVFGARASMTIGLGTGMLMTIVGTALGTLAGWRGGWTDSLVRRAADVTLGLPFVVGAILILTTVGSDTRTPAEIVLTLSALLWPGPARIARNATRTIAVQPFIEASRAVGAGDLRIVMTHVLPNSMPAIISFATPAVGLIISAEASLSFLGVGLQPPTVSWGLMIDRAQQTYAQSPHLLLFPGVFLVAAVAAFLLLGDALNDAVSAHTER